MQRRLELQNAKAMSSAPVVQLTLGDGLLNVFQPLIAAVSRPLDHATAAIAPPASNTPLVSEKMLLPPNRAVGPDMTVPEFCDQYTLSPNILEHLNRNSYTHASHLRFVSLADLDGMGFNLGEKAALRDAVDRWSLPA
jgi:hypothetical protein